MIDQNGARTHTTVELLKRVVMDTKTSALGIAAMLATGWLLGYAIELIGAEAHLTTTIRNGFIFGVSALVGGFIVRSKFIPIALCVCLVQWAVIVYVLYQVAEPVSQVYVADIVSHIAVDLVVSLIAAFCGAALGQNLASRLRPTGPD